MSGTKVYQGRFVMDTINDFLGEPVATIELPRARPLTEEQIAYLTRQPFPSIEWKPEPMPEEAEIYQIHEGTDSRGNGFTIEEPVYPPM
jgi:hypothetical protein